jgi:hypothetical protein
MDRSASSRRRTDGSPLHRGRERQARERNTAVEDFERMIEELEELENVRALTRLWQPVREVAME